MVVHAMVNLANSELVQLREASGGKFRGANDLGFGLLNSHSLTTTAGLVVQSAEATGATSAISTCKSRHETVFEFLLMLWLSFIIQRGWMQWVMDVEWLRSGEGKGHLGVLSDHDRPGRELVEHLVKNDRVLEDVEEEVAHGCRRWLVEYKVR